LLTFLLVAGCGAKNQVGAAAPSPVSHNAPPGDSSTSAGRAEPGSELAAARPLDLSKAKVMDVSVGPHQDQAGLTTERVGDIGDGGPTVLAATGDGGFYLFDAARSRVIQYSDGRVVRFLPIPYV